MCYAHRRRARLLNVAFCLGLLLCSSCGLPIGRVTPTITPAEGALSTDTGAAGSGAAQTGESVPEAAPLSATAEILPGPRLRRFAQEIYAVRIKVENHVPSPAVIDVQVTGSPEFLFIVLDGEVNQSVADDGATIVQRQLRLDPQAPGHTSYRYLFFGFVQTDKVTIGTQQFLVKILGDGDQPVRVPVQFVVEQ